MIAILTFLRRILGRPRPHNTNANSADPSPAHLLGLPPERFIKLASQLIDLDVRRKAWRHRKVEAIEWRGESLFRRKVSVDFSMPLESEFPEYWTAFGGLSGGPVIIPLSMMRKGVLHNFDIVDELRRPIPVCTRAQHEAIAQAALLTRAAEELQDRGLGPGLDTELEQLLVNIVRENDATIAASLLERFENRQTLVPGTRHSDQRQALLDRSRFVELLRNFTGQYLMCVFLSGLPGQRRVIKFAFEDQTRPSEIKRSPRRVIRRVCQYIGWWPRVTHVEIGDYSAVGSYHIEVAAPTELLIARADVKRKGGTGAPLRSDSSARRVHFYLTGSPDLDGMQSMDLEVHFALDPQGFLFSMMSVAIGTFLLLATGLLLHYNGVGLKQQDTAAVIVVALPGLLAALLFRSDEERLVAISVMSFRAMSAILVATSLAAAGLLVVNIDSTTRLYGWGLVTLLAGAAAFVTAVAWRLSKYWAKVASPPGAVQSTAPTAVARPRVPRANLGALTLSRVLITAFAVIGLVGLATALGARWPHLSLPSVGADHAVWISLALAAVVGAGILGAVVSWTAALIAWRWRRTSPFMIY